MIEEARKLIGLSLPMVVTQLGIMMLAVIDIMMVGHFEAKAIAAASLGNTWISCTRLIGFGVVLGVDPLISQAHGARDAAAAGLALQRGLVVALMVSLPTAILWLLTEDFLVRIGQDPAIAAEAHRYVLVQIPAIPAFFLFGALRAYLQCRGIMYPVMWLAVLANVPNAIANWALIYGHLGCPRLGLVGAGIATSIVQVLLLVVMVWWIVAFRLHRGAWRGWSAEALSIRPLLRVIALGAPVGIHIGLEVWAFSLTTLWAGLLGPRALAGHAVVLTVASFAFMVPLGISIAAVTRVGNLIGARRRRQAQTAAWAAFALAAVVMLTWATVFVAFRRGLPLLFTREESVVAVCVSLFPIAAAFQLFDGLQCVGGGILRGMGRTRPAAVFNFVGYYGLALPLGWWLSFELGVGVRGLWWGLCAGLAVVAALFLAWVAVRGPGREPGAGAE